MRMTIERMHIQNFKGIRDLEIDFGAVTRISGMNGTGKTTIPDAFSWVLFNKDSRGNAPGSYDFHEKPLDGDGNEIHNLDTTVELDCRLDGQRFNLKRTQRENWVKKRGLTEATFQGNVSTYWINDVETKLTDFKARIAQITSEEVFRLIGSLSAFNALDWKKRREQLIALSDTDVDGQLLSQERYRPLADECGQRGIAVDDLKKVLADQRKRTNDELRMIPVRIDEARKALPVLKEAEIRDAEYIVKDSLTDIQHIDGYIAEARAQSGAAGYNDRILALEAEAMTLQRTIADAFHAQQRQLEQQRIMAADNYRRATDALSDNTRRLEAERSRLAAATAKRDELRRQYSEEYERKFQPPTTDGICPTCHQQLPADMVQAAVEEAQRIFNDAKKAALSNIKAQGTMAAGDVKASQEAVERYEREDVTLRQQQEESAAARDAAYEAIKAAPTEPDYSAEPRIAQIRAQIADLKSEQKQSPDAKIAAYERRKAELNDIIERNRDILAKRDAGLETEKRIAELEQQQKDKAIRVSELEQLTALLEQFVQDRCHALEDSINAKFPTVRWKLFETQINGGINDVCQAYIPCGSSLVSYGSANTAAQVNADVEIINTLSKHYEIYLPLFADNSERVNVLTATDSQLISLAVSTDSELKIQTEMKEAV